MTNIFKEKISNVPSENLYVGEGVILGDIDYGETITRQVIRKTPTRLFIKIREKNGHTYYIDPTNGKRYDAISNRKPLKEFIKYNLPEKISRRDLKFICRNYNGKWNEEYLPAGFSSATLKKYSDFLTMYQIVKEVAKDRAAKEINKTEEHVEAVPCDRAFETNLTKEELEERGFFKPASKEIQEENKKITEKIVKHVKTTNQTKDDLSM